LSRLRSLSSLEFTLEFWNVTLPYFEPFEVERRLKHGDTIDLGDTVIHCHHTAGHTPGTMT
jgi:glyoxylase-like metal-dependent hydrolase (beta-lactamase superfamily II)